MSDNESTSEGTGTTAAAILVVDDDEQVRSAIEDILDMLGYTVSTAGGVAGSGADTVTLTIKDDTAAVVADADVWLSSDAAGATVVAGTKQTNSSGQVVFSLDAGVV